MMMMYRDRARSAAVLASMSLVSVSYTAASAPWSSVRLSAWLSACVIVPRSGAFVNPFVRLTIDELNAITANSIPGKPWYFWITFETAVTRTSAGSVTMSEPETSTRNRILTGNTALSGGVAQTSPRISSSLSITSMAGGSLSSGLLVQEDARGATAQNRAAKRPRRRSPATAVGGRCIAPFIDTYLSACRRANSCRRRKLVRFR